ncbi:MAG: tRNA (adenosine(37)-N6)-threonylcarbamoyltransferase complex dimerization subunit type 1 TsaB [Verrucomicrobia bacterium]|nr:tRNA (adenosine(37)-N6)-threonylcarbamoyltransferase complex dimerization subunit type 1 TsaB [Verrucomicrobiota bacterium]
MKGLIIDTSRDPAILGLIEDNTVVKMTLIEGAKNLSSTLFPALESFCKIKDLDFIAIGIGPGSYMGIRTGATIAKTLAFAANLPLIEFSSPLAFLPKNHQGTFAFIGDAKMGQLYVLVGDTKNRQISPPQLSNPEELAIGENDFIVGPGYLDPEPNLEWVAIEVYIRFIQKNFSDISSLELTYLR